MLVLVHVGDRGAVGLTRWILAEVVQLVEELTEALTDPLVLAAEPSQAPRMHRSAPAGQSLQQLGSTRVAYLARGFTAWLATGREVTRA